MPRGLRPILAQLVVPIRWGTNRGLGRQNSREVVGIGTARVYAHSKISHDADPHSRILGGGLCCSQLLITQKLQPHIKHGIHASGGSTPAGKELQAFALMRHKRIKSSFALWQANLKHLHQGIELGLVNSVAVNQPTAGT